MNETNGDLTSDDKSAKVSDVGPSDTDVNKAEDAARKLFEKGAPGEFRETLMAAFSGPMPNPLISKMTPEHVTSMLNLAHDHDKREFELAKGQQGIHSSSRWIGVLVLIILIMTLFGLCLIFRDQPSVLIPVITGFLGFATGAAGGYGFGKSRD